MPRLIDHHQGLSVNSPVKPLMLWCNGGMKPVMHWVYILLAPILRLEATFSQAGTYLRHLLNTRIHLSFSIHVGETEVGTTFDLAYPSHQENIVEPFVKFAKEQLISHNFSDMELPPSWMDGVFLHVSHSTTFHLSHLLQPHHSYHFPAYDQWHKAPWKQTGTLSLRYFCSIPRVSCGQQWRIVAWDSGSVSVQRVRVLDVPEEVPQKTIVSRARDWSWRTSKV